MPDDAEYDVTGDSNGADVVQAKSKCNLFHFQFV